jgi:nucleotide-binding universal stress UspA family protein
MRDTISVRNILIATDGSEAANRALDVAAALAKAMGGKLSILTVGGALSDHAIEQLALVEKDVGATLESMSKRILIDARKRAEAIGAPVTTEAKWGDPAEAILEAARTGHVDTIVMGRRGRGRLLGILLGSVSQKVASLAPCSVTIVP